ncbi:MAG: hypothetical protein H6838_12735 [Planctomycetes bacterium]|nr:hypothetical protein [Planctomycetota bacterium]
MRHSLAILTALLPCVPALAQNPTIDLNLWTVEDLNGAGPWTIDPLTLYAQTSNTVNTDCSVLYSDFDVVVLDFRMTVDPSGGDDDLIGFVLGWQPGDSSNTTADYILVDWKKITQTYQDWGTSQAGLALSRVTGPFTRGYGGGPIDLWSHTLNCTELLRSPTYGAIGWNFATDYFFRVIYTPGSVDIWLDGQHEFSLQGTFTPGRFGCYNFSQSRTEFQFPVPGAFTNYGTGCPASAGTPYLFGPVAPNVGENVPIIVANLPTNALPFIALGLSNQHWFGTPLPLDLTTFGAPGCTLLTSSDVLLPATNYNGTAYTTFQLPPGIPPSSTPLFYVQGLVLDPLANTLGLALSNAASVAVGIR